MRRSANFPFSREPVVTDIPNAFAEVDVADLRACSGLNSAI